MSDGFVRTELKHRRAHVENAIDNYSLVTCLSETTTNYVSPACCPLGRAIQKTPSPVCFCVRAILPCIAHSGVRLSPTAFAHEDHCVYLNFRRIHTGSVVEQALAPGRYAEGRRLPVPVVRVPQNGRREANDVLAPPGSKAQYEQAIGQGQAFQAAIVVNKSGIPNSPPPKNTPHPPSKACRTDPSRQSLSCFGLLHQTKPQCSSGS